MVPRFPDGTAADGTGRRAAVFTRFPDGTAADRTPRDDLADQLAVAVGSGADFRSAHGSYAVFVSSGISIGRSFEGAWELV